MRVVFHGQCINALWTGPRRHHTLTENPLSGVDSGQAILRSLRLVELCRECFNGWRNICQSKARSSATLWPAVLNPGGPSSRLQSFVLQNPSEKPITVIVGLGTDIVEITRIAQMIERHAESFLNRVFTDEEIRHCQKRKHCNEAYAGRWAAKEAVMKVLGTGFVKGIGWKNIEVLAETSGKPVVHLSGGAADHAQKIGISQVLITISHCRDYATATAIGVGSSMDDLPF